MCGRYAFFENERLYERFDVEDKITLEPRYNVAPGQTMPVVVNTDTRHVVPMRWGLLPFWAKDETTGYKMINARAETLTEKRSFKGLLKHHRCLVPANGFYEWQQTNGKVPYYIHLKHNPLFAFAGLYSEWEHPKTGKELATYTIITTAAKRPIAKIHDRMPVMLDPESEAAWLNPDIAEPDQAVKELDPVSSREVELYPITTKVNKPANDTADILKHV